jgi:monovalent cation:H+ antiporter-2, CPA2 family
VDHTAPAILELAAILLAAALAGGLARRAGLPAVVGYLAVGLVVSPFTPGYVADREQLQLLADIGVVLLLFEVGIEVDLHRLRREQRGILLAAPLQVLVSTAAGAAVALAAGVSVFGAAVIGLCVAFSSSVVVVNITRSRRRTTDVRTEQALLGWTVVQDVTAVALASLVVAVFARPDTPVPVAVAGLLCFGVVVVLAAWILPRALARIVVERDLFLLVSVASGLGLAGIGSLLFGVPLALAAFLAGLAVTEDPIAAEVRARLLPFRDLFAVLFFVVIGTLIDPAALAVGLPWLAALSGLVVLAKVVPAWILARAVRLDVRHGQLAIGLGQMGEFSFVLASIALATGALPEEIHAAILGTVVVSVAASTILVRLRPTSRDVAPASS